MVSCKVMTAATKNLWSCHENFNGIEVTESSASVVSELASQLSPIVFANILGPKVVVSRVFFSLDLVKTILDVLDVEDPLPETPAPLT